MDEIGRGRGAFQQQTLLPAKDAMNVWNGEEGSQRDHFHIHELKLVLMVLRFLFLLQKNSEVEVIKSWLLGNIHDFMVRF